MFVCGRMLVELSIKVKFNKMWKMLAFCSRCVVTHFIKSEVLNKFINKITNKFIKKQVKNYTTQKFKYVFSA